ncbi:Macrolide export protein MacA [Phycisphaerales bacterium]|nr:Macrolide export protein MacA [Phycisphaerales bacterium]
MWKWFLIVAVVLVLGCAGAGYYFYSNGQVDQWVKMVRPDLKPTEVRLAKSVRGDLVRTVSAPGQVEPKTKVEVSAQVSARILALPFRENERVKAGDVLVRLDARDLAALLDSAKAQLKSEEARLEGSRAAYINSQAELNRRRELYATKDIPKSELDAAETDFLRAESALHVAEHTIDMAKADIRRAEKNLDNTIITSPFDGVITTLNAEVGETVVVGTLNNPGSVIMEVADLSVMLLKARVDEANIAPILEGQKARVYVNAYKELTLTGTVDHVSLKREVDRDGTAFFEAEIILDLPPGLLLRSGLTANADVEVETFRDVVKVPSQAVLDRAIDDLPSSVTDSPILDRTKKFVQVIFTLEGGKARAHVVKTGASDLTDSIVTAGLDADAHVISGPFKALQGLKQDQLVVEQAKKAETGVVEAKKPEQEAPKSKTAGGT